MLLATRAGWLLVILNCLGVYGSHCSEKLKLQFETVDGTSDQLETAIDAVLTMQKLFIAKPSDVDRRNGFLISVFDRNELKALLCSGGKLLLLKSSEKLVGYALLTKVSEFTDLFGPGTHGHFSAAASIDYSNLTYLYQIAVDPQLAGQGLGRRLVDQSKQLAPTGLITDVLIEPLNNARSASLFELNGFIEKGTLVLEAYRDFGQLKSKVYEWLPSNT